MPRCRGQTHQGRRCKHRTVTSAWCVQHQRGACINAFHDTFANQGDPLSRDVRNYVMDLYVALSIYDHENKQNVKREQLCRYIARRYHPLNTQCIHSWKVIRDCNIAHRVAKGERDSFSYVVLCRVANVIDARIAKRRQRRSRRLR